ncbi:MAG: putative porin [Candidatus Omnitrophica bacterium]|nr:putative porin [Candidatus Omnitrophota bacterium]
METVTKKLLMTMLAAAVVLSAIPANASEIDILVEKLVAKGVLTHGEAQQVLTETREEVRRQVAAGESESLPKWVQTFKLGGDLRLRYQWEAQDSKPENGGSVTEDDRERVRIRMRLGAEAKVNDQMKAAVGLASGSSDPRSTNQTLQDQFSSKSVMLDYAYATWNPADWFEARGGKIIGKEVLWMADDLLWDSDVNPEGAAAHFSYDAADNISLFANAGWLILDETDGSPKAADPSMYFVQPGVEWSFMDGWKLKGALNAYGFSSFKGRNATFDNWGGTNTRENNAYTYDYDSFGTTVEIAGEEPFGGLVNYVSVFADYINNPDAGSDDTGWLLGFKFGDKKVTKFGQWQAKYQYRRLERDAWVDFLPDSDVLGGCTNVKSHEIILEYGLAKNLTLGIDYYNSKDIKYLSSAKRDEDLIQVDLLWKF